VNTDLMFSTGKDDWATPPEVFDPLNAEFRFDLDAAALSHNAKCLRYLGPDHVALGWRDALRVYWHRLDGVSSVWVNPPYSRGLQGRFIQKAAEAPGLASADGKRLRVAMLLPARTDTQAFHAWVWDRHRNEPHPWVGSLRFLKGRVRFVGAPASAPFPSMVVVFGR
jgi:phage N-6-adenine-methyltransferase